MKSMMLGLGLFVLVLFSSFFTINQSQQSTQLVNSEVELGKALFFDPILSADSSISCTSCHKPAFAFADTVAFSVGVFKRLGLRNAPSIMNLDPTALMFYDGRADGLLDQVHFPIQDSNEMHLLITDVLNRLSKSQRYSDWFELVYHSKPNAELLAKSIAVYEQTLQSSNTDFDRFMAGDQEAINASAKRGRKLFLGNKAKCFDCHFGPDFTGNEFKNIGLYDQKTWLDKGRYNVTKQSKDLGAFKVPGLRNVAVTGPYMHNGQFKTLEEVVAFYADPYALVKQPINMDSSLLKPSKLSKQEQKDLVAFMKTLTDKAFVSALPQKH